MAGSFFARMDELAAEVGTGPLRMHVEVSQPYAHVQEVDESYAHPRGGQAHALAETVVGGQAEWMRQLAARAVTPGGSELRDAAEAVVEGWDDRYRKLAPVDTSRLRESVHPTVTDDGATIYDRPPVAARLAGPAEELTDDHDPGNGR